jgi:hypothetical protein
MKHTLFILALITATIQTFAQSPRIKLNQITKDSVTGSVLISSPTDSGMVYSRDLFISYGADTVLILGADTLAATSSIISSVLSDGVTITGDGTTGNELTVDTNTVIATKQDLDLYYLDSNPDGYTSNTGTVTSVGGTGTVNGISLSGTVTSSGNLTLGGTLSGVDLTSQVTGTLPVTNGGTGSATQNFVDLSTTQTVGGAKTFTSALTQSGGNVNFDSGTLFVDESANEVGIGTTSPTTKLEVEGNITDNIDFIRVQDPNYDGFFTIGSNTAGGFYGQLEGSTDGYDSFGAMYRGSLDDSRDVYVSGRAVTTFQSVEYTDLATRTGPSALENANAFDFTNYNVSLMMIEADGDVGIGTSSPSEKLEVNGKVKIGDLTGTGGNAVYENGGVLGVASDSRFKSYIGDIDNGIQKVLDLRPKYFVDNRNSTFQQLGFYAQEVKSIINEASYPIGNTDYLGINDRAIIAVTVKAIQEQQAIIESQATEIEQLKSQIQLILNEIEQLKNN